MAELRQKAGEVYNPDIEELGQNRLETWEAELPDICPRRGRLQFDDFVSDTPDSQKDITRIKIDPDPSSQPWDASGDGGAVGQ
jgi:hypothetical protein